ncbi:uncharacterized protein LOC125678774 isoform X2 [Ostrea edulis]|uniref:uncharacterized protein LOC125678774 isoform X2 n=1 Tax=Ostrea edulis TaxID=37623 RepID=UPI0024AFA8F2|nr:uncharacterized protein LOC125678774 isoform X2 [Ostrea edulis]XP_055997034.1 uncharacterized protein LOC125678774 isoform X2 [Ostrea edulis]
MFLCNPYQRNQHNEAGSDVLKASSEIQHVSTTATTISQASATENVNPILPGCNPLEILAIIADNTALTEEKEKLLRINFELQQQDSGRFGYKKLKDTDYQYYTGFSKDRFNVLYSFLVPTEEDPIIWSKTLKGAKSLSTKDQLLLVLIKLRQIFDFKHISYLFDISVQDCSAIFTHWINLMFFRLGSVDIWPHREVIIENMPENYKKDFPDTFVIIDCTELKVQKPSSLNRQSQCYSDYKSCTTLKGLVGIDPRGSVIFSSMLFSGSVSDKVITKESGFLKVLSDLKQCGKLQNGDGVMVDKGFNIEKEIEAIGIRLNIPPFASCATQMKASEGGDHSTLIQCLFMGFETVTVRCMRV